MLALPDFHRAKDRIAPHIRSTRLVRLTREPRGAADVPLVDARVSQPLWLKLESEQASGSFKARGALNRVLSLDSGLRARGIVTASGGNHGLAVAFAGAVTGARTIVYLPGSASVDKEKRIAAWGAEVVRAGDVWDDAHAAASARAEKEGLTYIHPFADLEVVAGQGTIALEVPDADLFVVAIGGGGLISGVSLAAKLTRDVRVIGVEPEGAPTLQKSIIAGHPIVLDAIQTKAGTLAPRKSDALNVGIIQKNVDEIVLVSDEEMKDAARFLLREVGVGAELAGAAALAGVLSGRVNLAGAKNPCVLVCGAGADAL